MQGRSWMAALTLVASLAGPWAPATRAAEPTPIKQQVKLSLRLDLVSIEGGEVVIKPGHPGCRFETIAFKTKNHPRAIDGLIYLDPIAVETVSPDRDCSFAITVKEPGHPDKTVRRNLRIVPTPEGRAARPQVLKCYISSNALSPSPVAEKTDEATRKK